MSFAANLFLFNLQFDSAILEARSAQDDFFLMQLALQAGDISLYLDYTVATTLPTPNNPILSSSSQSSSTSSFEDDLFSHTNDDDSNVSITTYYSNSSWGSTGTMVSINSTSSNASSVMEVLSDYFYSL